jgi:diamine N-acetyltransferase
MFIQGPRVTVRALTRDDLVQMAAWRPYDDPLLADTNWMQDSRDELDRWYARCSRDPKRLLFAVIDESKQLIGRITLRERDSLRSARLGIAFGADYVDQGYGTEVLTLFLDYYFKELSFKRIVLDVAGHNRRAIHVYQKLGFVTVSQFGRPVERGRTLEFLKGSAATHARRFFRRDWMGRHWLLFYEMALERGDWEKRRAET